MSISDDNENTELFGVRAALLSASAASVKSSVEVVRGISLSSVSTMASRPAMSPMSVGSCLLLSSSNKRREMPELDCNDIRFKDAAIGTDEGEGEVWVLFIVARGR